MSIDIEALVVHFLQAQPEVIALVNDKVYTDMPHDRPYPLVLVNRTGGGSIYRNHLEEAEVSLSAYGGTHRQSYVLMDVCLSAMQDALVGAHPEGVVTKFRASSYAYEPDPDSADKSGHARPRYTATAAVTAHP
jgi:hypothetical protein